MSVCAWSPEFIRKSRHLSTPQFSHKMQRSKGRESQQVKKWINKKLQHGFYGAFISVMIPERLSRLLIWTGYSISGQHVDFALPWQQFSALLIFCYPRDQTFFLIEALLSMCKDGLNLCTGDISVPIKVSIISFCNSFGFSFYSKTK